MSKTEKHVSSEGVTPDRNAMNVASPGFSPDLNALHYADGRRGAVLARSEAIKNRAQTKAPGRDREERER